MPEAIDAWHAVGLDAADVRKLESVPVQIGNLGTSVLGLEAGGVITINQTAAGFNWYVNAGSAANPAFGAAGADGEFLASPGTTAASDVDLLTVLEHELGHMLGLPDNAEAGELMDTTLGLGVRRTPSATDLAAMDSSTTTVELVPQPSSPRSNDWVSPATVDAALAFIAGPVNAANGDEEVLTGTVGSRARSPRRMRSVKVAEYRPEHTSQSSLPYPNGPLTTRLASRFVNAEVKREQPHQ